MADDTSKNADFIGRVVEDANNPPQTRMLTGWFGDSGEEGYRRLYTDAELSSYVDIPTDAILYTEPIRDAQPAGAVIVWIKRDAAVKQGGSAFSRAARFLQGQVQQDFASGGGAAAAGAAGSLDKAGLRCATQAPCGEVTGFTGQCTNEPQVGGAWPCITAVPHCFEVTGFTGKCTHQPWPNPTRYIGCTIYHCPTHDLTHIPHICNIVASGLPGCGGVNPPDKGVDPARKTAAAEGDEESKEAAAPSTALPGCGYTKTWGLCETHLLGCGQTKDCPTTMPGCGQTNDCPTTLPGCGWSKNPICTDLPGCGFTKHFGACQQTQPPKCQVSVDIPCITQDAACGLTRPPGCGVDQFAQGGGGAGGNQTPATVCTQFGCAEQGGQVGLPASQICATNIACNFTVLFCHTRNFVQCHPTLICPIVTANCPTRFQPQCFPVASPFCPVTGGCPFGPGPVINPGPVFNPAAGGGGARFGAADAAIPNTQAPGCLVSGVVICPTIVHGCTVTPTSPDLGCTNSGPACPTKPVTQCTQMGPQCPTSCGLDCQSQQVNCTQIGPICGHKECTQNPDVCPTVGIACTVVAPCGTNTNVQLDCTFGCTQAGTGCPVTTPQVICANPAAAQAFAAQAIGPRPVPVSQIGCPASDFVACSQFGGCQTQPSGDCTFFGGCPTNVQVGAAGPVTACTQSGPQCPRTHLGQCPSPGIDCTVVICTHVGPLCPPHTRNLGCTHLGQCPSPGIDCTVILCTHVGPLCPNTHPLQCPKPTPFCPTVAGPQCPPHTIQGPACPVLTAGGPQCPVHSGFNCPSAIGCQSVACQSIACHPGGGEQQQQFAAAQFAAPAGGIHPALLTQQILQCNPSIVDACPTRLCTHQILQCNPSIVDACPTRLCTHQILQCNPSAVDACPTRLCTHQVLQCHPSFVDACPTQHFVQCNPSAVDACPTRIGCPTQNPVQCPPHSGFNCPSAIGCQSIACQSIACQPGGGQQQQPQQQQQFGAAAGGGGGFGGTQFGPQCRPSDTSVDQLCVVQPVTLDFICTTLPHTSIGPNCPPPHTPFCQPVTSLCFTVPCPPLSRFVICTRFGPQCPQGGMNEFAALPQGPSHATFCCLLK